MVAFGPQNLTREIESAGAGSQNAVTLCQQRDMKMPDGSFHRAFVLTATGQKVRQKYLSSPTRT